MFRRSGQLLRIRLAGGGPAEDDQLRLGLAWILLTRGERAQSPALLEEAVTEASQVPRILTRRRDQDPEQIMLDALRCRGTAYYKLAEHERNPGERTRLAALAGHDQRKQRRIPRRRLPVDPVGALSRGRAGHWAPSSYANDGSRIHHCPVDPPQQEPDGVDDRDGRIADTVVLGHRASDRTAASAADAQTRRTGGTDQAAAGGAASDEPKRGFAESPSSPPPPARTSSTPSTSATFSEPPADHPAALPRPPTACRSPTVPMPAAHHRLRTEGPEQSDYGPRQRWPTRAARH